MMSRINLLKLGVFLLGGYFSITNGILGGQLINRPRLMILTDIGGDPDDQQSMIRLLLFSNEFEIEGFVASASGTPGELGKALVQPHLIRELVEAYGLIRPNLIRYAPEFPEAQTLLGRIRSGNPQRGQSAIGDGQDTDGSEWIRKRALARCDSPLNIAIWGGQTDLAQALWRTRNDGGSKELDRMLRSIRVYDIADQDGIADWILKEFPDIFYVLNKAPEGADRREAAFRGMYLGGDESLTSREWLSQNVLEQHGPLGAMYPTRTWTAPNPHGAMKEGDTPSWFFFLSNGLNAVDHPEWGGWGGRFQRVQGNFFRDVADEVNGDRSNRASVNRWRNAFQNHFAARLDACREDITQANHAPQIKVFINGQELLEENDRVDLKAGEEIVLDASNTVDPEGDVIRFRWWLYPELNSLGSALQLGETGSSRMTVRMANQGIQGEAHLILEVTDVGEPELTSYQRIILKNNE